MKMMLFTLTILLLTIRSGLNDMTGDQKKNEIYRKLVDDSRFDLDYLYKEYLKLCPYDLQCPDYRPGTTNVDGEVLIDAGRNFPIDLLCNAECTCQPHCIFNNTCCPNVIYGYLRYTCVDVTISLGTDDTTNIAFFMIASCPSVTQSFEDTIDVKTQHAPVTSLYTGLTYKNISYAKCNADFQQLMLWNITFNCDKFLLSWKFGESSVEINSAEDIFTYINARVCVLQYDITHQDIPLPAPCKVWKNESKTDPIITSCNTSGVWKTFNWNIDFACRSFSRDLHSNKYQNIYCYMCNRGLAYKYFKDKPVISDCTNSSNDIIPAEISDACSSGLQTDYNLPFKNIYCMLCFDFNKTFDFYNDDYTTWLLVEEINEESVFNAYKKHIRPSDFENNEIYINASFSWNITYENKTMYKCLFPMNGLDVLPVCRSETKPLFQYNCSSNKTHLITGNEYSSSVEDVSRLDDHSFLIQFLLDIYLCQRSVMDNDLCEIDASTNMCSLEVDVDGNNKHLGCLFCTSSYRDKQENLYSGVRIPIKVTCPILPEESLFPDLSSFLQAAVEECKIMIVPSGVKDSEFVRISTETNECIDFPFLDKYSCHNMAGNFHDGSYRQLFSISRNDLAVLQNSKHLELTPEVWCAHVDPSAKDHPNAPQICRNVSCSVNHVFENGTCKVRQENVSYNQYRLHLFLQVDQNDNQQSVNEVEPCLECRTYKKITTIQICEHIWTNIKEHLEKTYENTKLSITECHVHIPQHACDNDIVDIASDLQMRVTLTFTIELTSSLSDVEKHLIDSLSAEYVLQMCDCHRRLFPVPTGYISHELASECSSEFSVNRSSTLSAVLTVPVDVNHLLSCPQIELVDDEYTICESKQCIILKANAKQLGVYNYELKNGTVRVCLDDLLEKQVTSWNVTLIQRVYKTVDNICTILSLVCLSVTFITYCLLPDIRNIPGYNNMNLIFSLFWAQFTLKFGLWQPTTSFLCPLFGILIHFFWMSTFCSMNVCSFHMYIVFHGSRNLIPSTKRIVYHMSYTYITPCAVIVLTVVVHLILSKGSSFGYGGTTCFITEPITSIVTFIVPCVLIFLANIIFFVNTYLSIRNAFKNSLVRDFVERSEFLIYVRLWTLLGIAWPLLIVDSLFEISAFSFVALSFNTLQGVFIFISYVCKQRVLDLYRARFNCKISNEQNDQSSSIQDGRHKLAHRCAGKAISVGSTEIANVSPAPFC